MLAFRLDKEFPKERPAREKWQIYGAHGAFISRLGGSNRFELIIPVRSPMRRHALKRILSQKEAAYGDTFELIDLQGFNADGAIWTRVDESQADAIAKRDDFVKRVDPHDESWLDA